MPRGKRKKKYTWDELINPRRTISSVNPYLKGNNKYRGRQIGREETIEGAIRRVTIRYEFGAPDVLEFVGNIRIK